MISLCNTLQFMSSLQYLDFSGINKLYLDNELGNSGMMFLSLAFSTVPTLKKLRLHRIINI